jgi:hypothetical protein
MTTPAVRALTAVAVKQKIVRVVGILRMTDMCCGKSFKIQREKKQKKFGFGMEKWT